MLLCFKISPYILFMLLSDSILVSFNHWYLSNWRTITVHSWKWRLKTLCQHFFFQIGLYGCISKSEILKWKKNFRVGNLEYRAVTRKNEIITILQAEMFWLFFSSSSGLGNKYTLMELLRCWTLKTRMQNFINSATKLQSFLIIPKCQILFIK